MPRSVRPRTERLRTEALLVRRVPLGEADLVVGLFTERRGLLSGVARGGRRSAKRFPALEPMHLLRVTLELRPGAELAQLTEAAIERPRLRLAADLARLDAAGRALRWVREIAPAQTAEPAAWHELNRLLDRLDDLPSASPQALLAEAGLRLLVAFGWGLELSQCVRCGRACDAAQAACVDPARGGLVCRACGGGPLVLRPEPRARLLAVMLGDAPEIPEEDVPLALDLVEGALTTHASGG
ncbi:DNA repair protein RecO [Sorangium cellulosum]|uniref:DNA repair protein RecO n=1 Tax=Sorangium cellulosum TaxID=56 RepID=A0A4P2PW53_SORCE|nr:DNA repair protein RecO [Sorangium cellulosum]AUX21065.1 DNA repair protein RecO [Sorangium cellulosum]